MITAIYIVIEQKVFLPPFLFHPPSSLLPPSFLPFFPPNPEYVLLILMILRKYIQKVLLLDYLGGADKSSNSQ